MKFIKLNIKDVLKLLPKKNKFQNKTDFGHTLIIAGSKKYLGAGILSSMAATRVGSGYIHLASDVYEFPWLKYPDVILHPFKISILNEMENYSVVIGPGLDPKVAKKFLAKLIRLKFSKVVVDASALNVLLEFKNQIPKTWIITPHLGEAKRILKIRSNKISNQEIAIKLSQFPCHVYLKGSTNFLISPEGSYFSCDHNHSSLAKAGSGDVLAGMIGGFLAMGLNPLEAMKISSWLHGELSLQFIKSGNDELSLRPTDLINLISTSLIQLRNKRVRVSKL